MCGLSPPGCISCSCYTSQMGKWKVCSIPPHSRALCHVLEPPYLEHYWLPRQGVGGEPEQLLQQQFSAQAWERHTSPLLMSLKSRDQANHFKGMWTAVLPWSEGRKAEASKSLLRLLHRRGSGSLSLKTWDLGVRLPTSLLKFSECIRKEEETGSVPWTDDSFSDYWVFLQHCARN